jgi:predicted nuclease with RNAse H fold
VLGASDVDILKRLSDLTGRDNATVVGIDAPLSYEPGGGLRDADSELRSLLNREGFEPKHVMPPTLTQMAYLTLRGVSLSRSISKLPGLRLTETHPYAALALRGANADVLAEHKTSQRARKRLTKVLDDWGFRELPSEIAHDDHLLAASAAAAAVADWQHDTARFFHAAEPPTHPFPVAC